MSKTERQEPDKPEEPDETDLQEESEAVSSYRQSTAKIVLVANGATAAIIATWLQPLITAEPPLTDVQATLAFYLLIAASIAVLGAVLSVNYAVYLDVFPVQHRAAVQRTRVNRYKLAEIESGQPI